MVFLRDFLCSVPFAIRTIETDSASVSLLADGLILQRFKSDARFDETVLGRIREAREQLAQGKRYGLLIVLPEGIAVQPQSMNADHLRWESNERRILAIAVVTDSADINAVSKFYFRYYVHAFEVKVFDEESDARDWLVEHMAVLAAG
jgi:hypothetical protein